MESSKWQKGDVIMCCGKEFILEQERPEVKGWWFEADPGKPCREWNPTSGIMFVRRPSSEQKQGDVCPGCGVDQYSLCKDDCPENLAWKAKNPQHQGPILGRLRGQTKHAIIVDEIQPKIECVPICICCTKEQERTARPDELLQTLHHDDTCQYTHDERYMLPRAKAMFRAGQAKRVEEEWAQRANSIASWEMACNENRMASTAAMGSQWRYQPTPSYFKAIGAEK